jgi:hypothetical protein
MVTPCSIVAGYHHFGGEDGGIMDLWNVGILLQHCTASQPRRPTRTLPHFRRLR